MRRRQKIITKTSVLLKNCFKNCDFWSEISKFLIKMTTRGHTPSDPKYFAWGGGVVGLWVTPMGGLWVASSGGLWGGLGGAVGGGLWGAGGREGCGWPWVRKTIFIRKTLIFEKIFACGAIFCYKFFTFYL